MTKFHRNLTDFLTDDEKPFSDGQTYGLDAVAV